MRKWPSCSSGRQGILDVIISLLSLFEGWWLMPKSVSPFQSLVATFQMSLTREHPDCAKALLSLTPPTPSGKPLELRIDGLPKMGYLRTSSELVGSDLIRPGLTFNQAPTMFFHIEHLSFLSLGAARNQFRSGFKGPLPWTGNLVWSTLCRTNSFQGSPLGARPLMKSLASNARDWALGSVTPRPPWEVGSARVSHLTLAHVNASLPPHMKFLMSPLTWLHIFGSGFQHAARY